METDSLLAEYCMEKQYIVSISHIKIGEMLNSNELKTHLSKYWCIPKQNDSSFVANMEDILGIYKLPYCKEVPIICKDIKKIIMVSDNLNTHNKTAFYEAFSPETAYWLSQKFKMHYTHKHGSWLNIVETKRSSLNIQCLGNRRIDSLKELNFTISQWEKNCNLKQIGVNWQFTAEDARIKLKRLRLFDCVFCGAWYFWH